MPRYPYAAAWKCRMLMLPQQSCYYRFVSIRQSILT